MTLTAALDAARAGLTVTSGQIAVTSQNVSRAGDPSASRKIANAVTVNGSVQLAVITRASNDALLSGLLSATAAKSQQAAISAALTSLETTAGDPQNDTSVAALAGKLSGALQNYSASPSDPSQGRAAIVAASNIVDALHRATATVQTARETADAQIAISVDKINASLKQFGQINQSIVNGTIGGTDISSALDARDAVLKDLASEIGIETVPRSNNDVAIYTDSGVTLFDKSARQVQFTPTLSFVPATAGNQVVADGVPITAPGSVLSLGSGNLAGLAKARDGIAVTYQSQLDEIARSLIYTFRESASGLPDSAGLFTSSPPSAPAVAGVAVIQKGLAATISIAAAADPSAGGNATSIRDGGIAGAAYTYNTAGAAGYTARLNALVTSLDSLQAFDPSAQASTSASVAGFAASSVSYLEGQRQSASATSSYSATLLQKASDALSNSTGVNLDTELSNLLALERSYQASAKLITAVDSLYQSLFSAIQ